MTIGYLYYDLMNLYGDIGNLKVLIYHLNKQGIKTNIKYYSLGDKIDFSKLDLIYIGSGTEDNRIFVLNDILKHKEEINKAINDGKFFLVTGNALALFGKKLNDLKALETFDFDVKTRDKRLVKEVKTKSNVIKEDIYGFINHNDLVEYNNCNNLFVNDGIIYNNFYGTYMIGPLLVRNPLFTKYFIKKLIKHKNPKFKMKSFNINLDTKAYNEFIEFKKAKN